PAPQRRALEVALLLEESNGPPVGERAVALAFLGILRSLARTKPACGLSRRPGAEGVLARVREGEAASVGGPQPSWVRGKLGSSGAGAVWASDGVGQSWHLAWSESPLSLMRAILFAGAQATSNVFPVTGCCRTLPRRSTISTPLLVEMARLRP